jgi:hypothetical protein
MNQMDFYIAVFSLPWELWHWQELMQGSPALRQGHLSLLDFVQLQRTVFFRNLSEAFYWTFARWADFYSLRLTVGKFKCPSQQFTVKVSPSGKSPLAVKVHPLS